MKRAALVAGLITLVFAASVSAAGTQVGSGTTAWGTHYTLTAQPQSEGSPCVDFTYESGSAGGCAGGVQRLSLTTAADCERRHFAAVGTFPASATRVQVRFAGGRVAAATLFPADPSIDPSIGYWVVTATGLPPVRSVTAVAADGSVLERWRPFSDAGSDCVMPHPYRGKRFLVARATDPLNGDRLRLYAYRRTIFDDKGHHNSFCMGVSRRPRGARTPSDGGHGCDMRLRGSERAIDFAGGSTGCREPRTLVLYGLARRRVARVAGASRYGTTTSVPVQLPRWLRTRGQAWLLVVKWPDRGVAISGLDARGKTLGRTRATPTSERHAPPGGFCADDIFSAGA